MKLSESAAHSNPSREYQYRVLVYPNITYQRNLSRDSYIVVIKNVLEYMTMVRPDVYWVVLLPERVDELNLPHVEQRILPLPTYPNRMRTHFDADGFLDLINWREEDFDIVYSHLPEHTAQMANAIVNSTHLNPKFMGYCHWFEVPENTAYRKTMLWANLAGLLQMEECGVNSEWLKDLALEKFSDMAAPKVVERLEEIIQPHYLGIDQREINTTRSSYEPGAVVFNHRPNEYTGWNWFINRMDELWERRQDFTVYTTLASVDRPWAENAECESRQDYLNFLHEVPQFGVGCFQMYSAWSISTTDGLSQGVPYLLPDGLCYTEMVGEDYPLLYPSRDEFVGMFESLLDNPTKTESIDLNPIVSQMMWANRIDNWFGGWDNFFDLSDYRLKSKTDAYKAIRSFIEDRGSVTKSDIIDHMGWGAGVPWSQYRNMLRTESNITLTKRRYEYDE